MSMNNLNKALLLTLLGVCIVGNPHFASAASRCKSQKSQLSDANRKYKAALGAQRKGQKELDQETRRLDQLISKLDSKNDQCNAKVANEQEKGERSIDKWETKRGEVFAELQTLAQQALQQCGISGIIGEIGNLLKKSL